MGREISTYRGPMGEGGIQMVYTRHTYGVTYGRQRVRETDRETAS